VTVAHLIEKLQQCRPDAHVRITMWKSCQTDENPSFVETDDTITVDANEIWDDGGVVDICDYVLTVPPQDPV
jgi:hypothetical protein